MGFKKNKIILCPICNGEGYKIEEISREKNGNDVIVTSKKVECEYCNSYGLVKTDGLTYYIKYNVLANKIHNLEVDRDEEALVYKTCEKCSGRGSAFKETINTEKSNLIIEVYSQCSNCNGMGEELDEVKTKANKDFLINFYNEKMKELENFQNVNQNDLLYRQSKRGPVEFMLDSKYNICLNCDNYRTGKWGIDSINPICKKCCNYDVVNCQKTLFKPIGKKSEIWYNKFMNPLLTSNE